MAKKWLVGSILAVLTIASDAQLEQPATRSEAATIEVCFVLDTTGSMAGLVEAAKQKIWAIANEVVKLKPQPSVSFCLVAFRDRGDEYVTRVTPLTANLDAVYADLVKFAAQGGGDTPEAVNQALFDTLSKVQWSSDPQAIKLIYLTGDAPGHVGRANEPQLNDILALAASMGIVVNAIQCGDSSSTTEYWQKIVALGDGRYGQVAQSGNVDVVSTPFDQDFGALQLKLNDTLLVYGSDERRAMVSESLANIERAQPSVVADRLSFFARLGRVIEGDGDLLADLHAGKVELAELPVAQLPLQLRELSPTQRRERLAQLGADRAEYLRVIKQLINERETLLMSSKASADASFDREVIDQLKTLAARRGYRLH